MLRGYYRKDGDKADKVYMIEFEEDGSIYHLSGPLSPFNCRPFIGDDNEKLPAYRQGMFIGPIDITTGNTYAYEKWRKERNH